MKSNIKMVSVSVRFDASEHCSHVSTQNSAQEKQHFLEQDGQNSWSP